MRVKGGVKTSRKHKKILKATKGYWMTRSKLYKVAHQAFMHAGQYAYNHRQRRHSQMRNLWIVRLSAAAKQNGTTYSRMISAMKKNNIELDRKVLSDLAFNNPEIFSFFVKSL